MPWSNQSGGGGWKGGGGGPWGPRPGGPRPAARSGRDLRRSQDRIRQAMPGGRMGGPLLGLIGVVLVALVGFFGFTVRVDPEELGIVLRFGQYVRQLPPGLNFRWPYPIEQVELPKVTRVNRIEIGMRGSSDARDASSTIRDVPQESLMLTGDENIVDLDFSVTWRVADARKIPVRHPEPGRGGEGRGRERHARGGRQERRCSRSSPGRGKMQCDAAELMQKTLDSWGAGVSVVEVQIRTVDPPARGRRRLPRRAGRERRPGAARRTRPTPTPTGWSTRPRARPSASSRPPRAIASRSSAEATGDAARFTRSTRIQAGARRDPRAPLSGDHGAGAGRLQQGDHRRQGRDRASCPIFRCRPFSKRPAPAEGQPRNESHAHLQPRVCSRLPRSSANTLFIVSRPSRRSCCASASRSA